MRQYAVQNVVYFGLATLGMLMLLLAYLSWVDHSLTLWLNLP